MAQNNSKLKLGLVQAKVSNKIDTNLNKTAKSIKKAAEKGANIVCLQELFAVPYFAQTENKEFFKLAEAIPGKITSFLCQAAKENSIAIIGGSLFEKGDDNKYYNTSLVFDANGKLIAKYRKIHVPYDPNYYEQYYFSSGNLGYAQAALNNIKNNINNIKIAPLICYDQWYPEAARINALKGAQIIFYPTAIGWFERLKKYEPFSAKRWENAMRAHASMNGIYVAAVNRVGKEDELTFWGNSFIADPHGEVIAKASSSKEEVLIAEIDINKVKASQEGWGFLRNRKPESYKDLAK